MTISAATQACFTWALAFVVIGFFFRYFVPRQAGQFEIVRRLNSFREWVAMRYRWTSNLDYGLAGLSVIVGAARLLMLHA